VEGGGEEQEEGEEAAPLGEVVDGEEGMHFYQISRDGGECRMIAFIV
jgi:hypothetical protein